MGMSSSQARLLNLTARMHQIEYKAAKLEAQKLQMANDSRRVYDCYLDALDATKIQMKKINPDGSFGFEDATYNKLLAAGYSITFLDPAFASLSTSIPAGYTAISTASELQNISPSGKYYLTNDIDLQGINWTPIDDFTGNIEGNGHVIKNMSIDNGSNNVAFIAVMNGGSVSNLGFKNSMVKGVAVNTGSGDSSDIAVLVAMMNAGTIDGCWVDNATIRDGSCNAGAIVSTGGGSNCTIKNCYVTGSVNFINIASTFGDIIGFNNDEHVQNCYSTTSNVMLGYGGSGSTRVTTSQLQTLIDNGTLPGASNSTSFDEYKNDPQWLASIINAGYAIISKPGADGIYYETSVATDTSLQEVSDESELKKAEAKYEADMKCIDLKDRKYDTELAALDTERNAIKQEMDTLKTVAKENVERTFKLFG